MMDKETTQRIFELDNFIVDANKAKQLLENPLYTDAWDILDEAIYNQFMNTNPSDIKGLQITRLGISIAKQLRGYFETLVNNGKIANFELSEIAKDENISDEIH